MLYSDNQHRGGNRNEKVHKMCICLGMIDNRVLPSYLNATTYSNNFSGTVQWPARNISLLVKGDGNRVTNLNYTTTKEGSKYISGGRWIWFGTWNGNTRLGIQLIKGHGDGAINLNTNTSSSKEYVLAGNRENIWDPETQIYGTWRP